MAARFLRIGPWITLARCRQPPKRKKNEQRRIH
jgi:hypothetical protein